MRLRPRPVVLAGLLLVLFSGMVLPRATLSAPPTPPAVPKAPRPEIAVDGLIDAGYRLVASDPAGDGNGNAVMDLRQLYVAEDADNWYFAFVVNADIVSTNWGKYVIYIDTTNDAQGAPSDAWTRNVVVNDPHKPEYGLYSWVDCAYGPTCTQFWAYGNGSWEQFGQLDGAALSTNGITSTLEWRMARWRLGDPDELWCEVWSTGGGSNDNAQDTVNDPADDWNASDWSTTAVLFNSSHVVRTFYGPSLTVYTPAEGQRFGVPGIDVTGEVSPTGGVTVTVDLNGAATYTPTVAPDGSFAQGVTLVSGTNTLTVTAASVGGATTVVRHVFLGAAAHDGNVEWYGVGHFTRDTVYHDPFGPAPTGSTVTFRLRTYHNDVTHVTMRTWDDLGTPQEVSYTMHLSTAITDPLGVYDYWEVDYPTPDHGTFIWYKFRVEDTPDVDWYEDDDVLNGWGHMVEDATWAGSFRLVVYEAAYATPQWLQDGVVYQVFPDRFRNGLEANDPISGTGFIYGDTVITHTVWNEPPLNPRDPGGPFYQHWSADFFGGDLQGIIDELDYLHDLGVTVLYLNPIFLSPSNHKYDTTDFEQIDPHFGDLATFDALIDAAEARGMHVVLDGVFNHTSSDSYYFDHYGFYPPEGACESAGSPYRSWYFFTSAPNSCPVCDGGMYYESWWGYCSLPILNSDNPAVRGYIYGSGAFGGTDGIAAYWPRHGSSGWRLDVGGDIDAGYLDTNYWEEFRAAVHAVRPDAAIIGEEWGDAARWLLGNEWDAVMNYQFRGALLSFLRDTPYVDNDANAGSSTGILNPLTPSQFNDRLLALMENYPPPALYAMLNLLGSHDVNRVLFVLNPNAAVGNWNPADVAAAKEKLYLGTILQFTLPGAPTIYYGDEAGSYIPSLALGGGGLMEDDPYNRIPFPWPDESGTPAFPFDQALHDHYARLAQIRHGHPALRTGSFVPLLADDEDNTYAYGRRLLDDLSVVVVNRAASPQSVAVPLDGFLPEGTILEDALNGGTVVVANDTVTVTLPGLWGAILVLPAPCISPTAAFSYTASGLTVTFHNASTGTEPLSYQWDFGDGGTSDLENPVHTYGQAGDYSVVLTASNACGWDRVAQEVVVGVGRTYRIYLPLALRGWGR